MLRKLQWEWASVLYQNNDLLVKHVQGLCSVTHNADMLEAICS